MAPQAAQRASRLPSGAPPDIGRRIRQARQERGLSLAQLGQSELTRGFLSAVETGRSGISLQALSLVAERLGLPITYFIGDTASSAEALSEFLLNEAENALRSQNAAEALRRVEEAPEFGPHRSRHLWLRGWAMIQLGKAREAISILEEAAALAEAGNDSRHHVHVRYTLGLAFATAANLPAAMAAFQRTYDLVSGSLDDPALLGRVTVCIGHVLYEQGKYDLALAQYARARDLFDTLRDFDNLAAVYTGLSRIYRQEGNLHDALRYSRLSLGIFEAKHDQREAAHELSNMAARYEEMGDTEQAIATANDAIARAQLGHSPDIEALARSTLAAVYLRLGQPDQVAAQAEQIEQLGLGEGDRGYLDSLIVLARAAELAKDSAQADQLYQRALEGLKAAGIHGRYASVALTYSEALRARGDVQGALEFAVEAARSLAGRPA
jgi:tetratricopeptide (TPR) repeat protein